jgi:predicted hydrocarbon binding protein
LPFTELESGSYEDLTRDKEHGLLLEDGKRVVSFRLATFQALVNRMTEMAGDKVGKTLLFQMGSEIGRVGLRYSKEKILEDNVAKVFDKVIRHRGWGRCLGIEKQGNNANAFIITMSDCPLCYGQKSAESTCDLMRGIVTGWMEALLERKSIRSVETDCGAVKGPLCVFEVSFSTDNASNYPQAPTLEI